MPLTRNDLAIFAARVFVIADDVNKEHRMSVQVKGLADIVRQAKSAIDTARAAAVRLNDSAQRVVNTIGQVDDMTRQLDAANADLTAAVGAMSNGGPPLETTGQLAPASPTTTASEVATTANAAPGETIDSSIVKVQNANAAP